jgi:phosphohistidine phosphatase SixA
LKVDEMVRCLMLAIAMLFASAVLAQSAGMPDPNNALTGEALVRALKGGGYTLVFRHAAREPEVMERNDRISMADCATQIPLSVMGRAQARSIGEVMNRLGIPMGEVIASPFCRTMDTARLIAGRVRAENAVAGRNPESWQDEFKFDRLAEIVSSQPDPGTNRLVVGHANAFVALLGPPILSEGEVGIIRVVEGRRLLVARLRVEDWQVLR